MKLATVGETKGFIARGVTADGSARYALRSTTRLCHGYTACGATFRKRDPGRCRTQAGQRRDHRGGVGIGEP